ncbi:unnamed protein product [Calicophoron daubneyi]|uniref:Uncharacterized protein n=1 Tax=Calicophoron daubneyi TaxID=300641 RepID=A0AAV2T3X7_CALDB
MFLVACLWLCIVVVVVIALAPAVNHIRVLGQFDRLVALFFITPLSLTSGMVITLFGCFVCTHNTFVELLLSSRADRREILNLQLRMSYITLKNLLYPCTSFSTCHIRIVLCVFGRLQAGTNLLIFRSQIKHSPVSTLPSSAIAVDTAS